MQHTAAVFREAAACSLLLFADLAVCSDGTKQLQSRREQHCSEHREHTGTPSTVHQAELAAAAVDVMHRCNFMAVTALALGTWGSSDGEEGVPLFGFSAFNWAKKH